MDATEVIFLSRMCKAVVGQEHKFYDRPAVTSSEAPICLVNLRLPDSTAI